MGDYWSKAPTLQRFQKCIWAPCWDRLLHVQINWNALRKKNIVSLRPICRTKQHNFPSVSMLSNYLHYALFLFCPFPHCSGAELMFKGLLGSTEQWEKIEDIKKIFWFKETTMSGEVEFLLGYLTHFSSYRFIITGNCCYKHTFGKKSN